MRWLWSRREAPTHEPTRADRRGAREAYKVAQGQSGEVARAVEAAALVTWRTGRIAREIRTWKEGHAS